MQCPVCSKEVDPQSPFCKHCGASIAAAPASGYTTVPGSAAAGGAGPSASNSGAAGPGGANPGYTSIPGSSQAYTSIPQQPGQYAAPMPAGAGLSDNAAAAIAYITFIPAVVFLALEPYNRIPLVRFHSWQSIGLFLAGVLLHFAAVFCSVALHFIPFIHLLFLPIHFVISVGLFIAWLIAILKASKGEWYKLPFLGDFAEKQARG